MSKMFTYEYARQALASTERGYTTLAEWYVREKGMDDTQRELMLTAAFARIVLEYMHSKQGHIRTPVKLSSSGVQSRLGKKQIVALNGNLGLYLPIAVGKVTASTGLTYCFNPNLFIR